MPNDSAIYVRISDDKEGLEAGVTRQTEDSLRLAGRDVPDDLRFNDNDISASTRSTKVRPAFARMVSLIEAGQIKHVYAYSSSRLTRRPRELEDLIVLTERYGVLFHLVTGRIDLLTADGRMLARMLAAADAAEAERIGERVARQKQQRAENGLPQGGRYATFGFDRAWNVDDAQAAKVREAFRRRASGESIGSISKSIGVGHGTLVNILKNPVYTGLRRYRGEVVGELHEGFPRLVDRVVWDAVQAVGEAPPPGTNTRKHLLSGIARCKVCSGKMKGAPASARASRYRCAATYGGCGKVSIRCDWIDDPVVISVVAREVFDRKRDAPEEVAQDFDAEADEARAEIAQVQDAVTSKQITLATALPLLAAAEQRLKAVERQRRQAAVNAVDPNWAHRDARELFQLSLGEMRALLARHLDAVVIAPAPTNGRNSIDLTRVELVWKSGEVEQLQNGVPVVDVSEAGDTVDTLYGVPINPEITSDRL
ncbi:recombinase family protein [Nocardioides nanhaiensis]|uniref:recombinase family protein n=1 Tax=Nocardioides nanhaiensis TaxID=1476871 RepID=UPI0031EB9DF0